MKKIILSIMAMACMAVTANAEMKEKNIEVREFEKIELYGATKVVYTQGDKCSVTVKGEEEHIDKIEAYSNGQTLSIRQIGDVTISRNIGFFDFLRGIKTGFREYTDAFVVYVTSPDIISVMLTGSGDFESRNHIDTDNMEILLVGSGDIDFDDIICDNITAELRGSGDIDIKKLETIKAEYTVKGSGDIDVRQQNVRDTRMYLVGSGDIKVNCKNCDNIDATVTGSGDITINGDFKNIKKTIKGSGDIRY